MQKIAHKLRKIENKINGFLYNTLIGFIILLSSQILVIAFIFYMGFTLGIDFYIELDNSKIIKDYCESIKE